MLMAPKTKTIALYLAWRHLSGFSRSSIMSEQLDMANGKVSLGVQRRTVHMDLPRTSPTKVASIKRAGQ